MKYLCLKGGGDWKLVRARLYSVQTFSNLKGRGNRKLEAGSPSVCPRIWSQRNQKETPLFTVKHIVIETSLLSLLTARLSLAAMKVIVRLILVTLHAPCWSNLLIVSR